MQGQEKNVCFHYWLQKKIGSLGRDFYFFILFLILKHKTNFSHKCIKENNYIISDIYKFIMQFYTRYSQDTVTCC